MATVKTFDEKAILKDLKEAGKTEAIALIEAYKRTLENQRRITAQAISKIRELSNADKN